MLQIFASIVSPVALFWLAAVIIFCCVEAATVGLVSIWFAGGSLAALIAASLGAPFWLQITLFVVVSGVLIALLRPLMRKVILPKKTATNADRHIGQVALVTEEIDNLRETGAVKLDGVVWTARSLSNQVIPVGTAISVRSIQGVKVIVEPVPENLTV